MAFFLYSRQKPSTLSVCQIHLGIQISSLGQQQQQLFYRSVFLQVICAYLHFDSYRKALLFDLPSLPNSLHREFMHGYSIHHIRVWLF
jgi:hypothetical protein